MHFSAPSNQFIVYSQSFLISHCMKKFCKANEREDFQQDSWMSIIAAPIAEQLIISHTNLGKTGFYLSASGIKSMSG